MEAILMIAPPFPMCLVAFCARLHRGEETVRTFASNRCMHQVVARHVGSADPISKITPWPVNNIQQAWCKQ